jgi:hypothetical protein
MTEPLHSVEEMPAVLRQMAKYDTIRRAVLNEAADHIDALLAGRSSMVETVTSEHSHKWRHVKGTLYVCECGASGADTRPNDDYGLIAPLRPDCEEGKG